MLCTVNRFDLLYYYRAQKNMGKGHNSWENVHWLFLSSRGNCQMRQNLGTLGVVSARLMATTFLLSLFTASHLCLESKTFSLTQSWVTWRNAPGMVSLRHNSFTWATEPAGRARVPGESSPARGYFPPEPHPAQRPILSPSASHTVHPLATRPGPSLIPLPELRPFAMI